MQLAAAAAERRRIGARRLHARVRHLAEQRVGGRRHGRSERREGDDASDLRRRRGTAACSGTRRRHPCPFGTAIIVPSRIADTMRDWTGLPSISSRNQLRQDERALRVGDEHEAAALVVVLQVVVATRHAHRRTARRARASRGAPPASTRAKPGQRDLPIERRERPALRREARELLLDDVRSPPGRRSCRCSASDRSRPSGRRRSSRSAPSDSAAHVSRVSVPSASTTVVVRSMSHARPRGRDGTATRLGCCSRFRGRRGRW